jgi:hypothetical protein
MSTVRHDVFPAFAIFLPADDPTPTEEMRSAPPSPKTGRSFDKARVVVYGTRVMVAIDGNDGPKIVFSEEYVHGTHHKNPDKTKDSYITTVSGKKIAYRRNDACGCGSRLRSWNPYKTLNSTKDPTE